jgi:hypothetical protein
MGRPRMHENHAARQRAYAARMRQERAEQAKAAKRDKERNQRIAIEKAEIMNNLREWLSLVGEDGIDAAQRTARKTLHPDVGGKHNDFVPLTALTEWVKKEVGKKQFGFRVFLTRQPDL